MSEAPARGLVGRWVEKRAVERPPIVLHLGSYAARLQQITYRQMCGDATLLANALEGAQRLFGCDGLILPADPTVEAEACGCQIEWREDEPAVVSHPLAGPSDSPAGADGLDLEGIEGRGRLSVVLEAAARLAAVIGKDLALIPAVTGPLTLAAHLRGPAFWSDLEEAPERAHSIVETAAQVTLLVARRYLEMGFEQLVVSDPLLGRVDPAHYPAIAFALRSLWNVGEFFDARLLLHTEIDDASLIEQLGGMGAHALLLEGDACLGPVAAPAGGSKQMLGIGLPACLLESEPPDLERMVTAWRAEACPAGSLALCLTIPRSTSPEKVHALIRLWRSMDQ